MGLHGENANKKTKKKKKGGMGKNVSRESRIGVACPVVLLYFSFETRPEAYGCVYICAYVCMHVYSGSIFLARIGREHRNGRKTCSI